MTEPGRDLGGGAVVNDGEISVRDGGLAAFVAPVVENSGIIRARWGRIALAGGRAYDPSELTGDDALAGRIELRHDFDEVLSQPSLYLFRYRQGLEPW